MNPTSSGNKRLHQDAAYVYGAYVLRYLSVLVLVPYYGRVLGPQSYGTVLAAMSLMSIVWILVNFGFSTTGARDIARNAPEAWGDIYARQLAARLILIPAGLLVGLAGVLLSPALRSSPGLGLIATALGILNALNLSWLYQGLRRFKLCLIFEAAVYPLNVASVLLFVRGPGDAINAMASLIGATGLVTAAAYWNSLRLVRPSRPVFSQGIAEIRAASVIFLQTINSIVMTSGSTFVLSVLSTAEQVAYFGSVEKLVTFALAFLQPAAQVLIPTITHSAERSSERRRLIKLGVTFESLYGICAGAGFALFAPYIIGLAFGPNFGASVPIMRVIAFAFPVATLTHAIGCYLFLPLRQERLILFSVLIGNFFNLAIILNLATSMGGMAVAIARVVAELVMVAVTLCFAWRMRETFDGQARTLGHS